MGQEVKEYDINSLLGTIGSTNSTNAPTEYQITDILGNLTPYVEPQIKRSNQPNFLKGAEFFARGGMQGGLTANAPQLASPEVVKDFGKATAAFLDNTIGAALPYGAKQIGYLFGRTIGDTPEMAEKISNKMASIVDKPFGKAFGVSDDPQYKGEATTKLMEFVGNNIEKGSGWISQQTGLPKSDVEWMINTAMPKIIEQGAKITYKGSETVANQLSSQYQKAKANLEQQAQSKITPQSPTGVPVENIAQAPKEIEIPVTERIIEVPSERPTNIAETNPFKPEQINAREALLRKIGHEDIRNSALEGNPKEAASQFITSQADQGPYGSGMTEQIKLEKEVQNNHLKNLQDEIGGISVRQGTSFQEGDKIRVGKTIKEALQEGYENHQKETTKLYNKAKENFGETPVDLNSFNQFLKDDSNFAYSEQKNLQNGIKSYLKSKNLLDENGNVLAMTVSDAEGVRKYINSKYHPDTKYLGGELKGTIDADVFGKVGGETYENARSHFKKGIEVYDNPKAVGDLLADKGVNEKIADEKVGIKVVTLPNRQFQHLFDTLSADNQTAAVNQIKTSLIDQIKQAGNSAEGQPWNSVAAAKEASALGEKLKIAFKDDSAGLQKIYDNIEAGNILYIPNKYPGAAVQSHLLKNKFGEMAVRRGATAIGGTAGSIFGPLGAGVGATMGETAGEAISSRMRTARQAEQLGKEIKKSNQLKDIGKD